MLNKKFAERLIILISLVSLVFFVNLKDLRLDYRFENFFPENDPDLVYYYDFVNEFETDNDFFIVGIKNNNGIFKQEFLQKLEALTDTLRKIEFINSIKSPTSLKFPVAGPFGVITVPYIHTDKPEFYKTDSARIYASENLVGSLFSEDGKIVSIQLKHEEELVKSQIDQLVLNVENTVASFDFDETHIVGKIRGQHYFTEQMIFELLLFVGISIILVSLFLYFSFRAFWGVWVPFLVIGFSVLWLLSLLSFINKPINLLTTLLPTILFVVGISNVVHILERFIYELRNKAEKLKAIKIAFKEVGLATFLTSFTTAVGFFTLNTSNILPVKEFGTYTAIGVLISFVLAFTLLPSVLVIAKKPEITKKGSEVHFWTNKLAGLFAWLLPNRRNVLAGFLGLIVISGIGISLLKVDNFFIEDWVVKDEIRDDYRFFEKQFSGFRPFDIAIWVKDSSTSFNDYEVLKELEIIDVEIKKTYKTKFVVSPLNFVKIANQSIHGGKSEYYKIPDTEKEYKSLISKFRNFKSPTIKSFVNQSAKKARFSAKIIDYGGAKMNLLNQDIENSLQQKLNPKLIGFQLTGMPYLVDKNNKKLSTNLIIGLLIAFLIVAVLMGLLFKSFSMIIVALIPNILPLGLIAAFMGYFGIDLKIATSIIFTIAFGIAVDDTIHFMSKYRIELNKNKGKLYALKRTFLQTGKAIVVTSIILSSGFFILILSQVTSSFYIGLLISLTLLFALICNLVLLPVLILYLYNPERK